MILEIVYSINDVPVRLTDTQWEHIVDEHPYMSSYYNAMLDAVEQPTYILRGHRGALMAVVPLGRRKYLHIMYREVNGQDGFIITAYIKSNYDRQRVIWREEDQ